MCTISSFRPQDWQQALSFACVTVLESGLALLDSEINVSDHFCRISAGNYDLLSYAISFWSDHLLECSIYDHILPSSSLGVALEKLYTRYKASFRRLKGEESSEKIDAQLDARLQSVAHLSIAPLCSSSIAYRYKCKESPVADGEG